MQVKYKKICVLQVVSFSLKYVWVVFVCASIISSHLITESSIIVAKYFPISQLHVARFQI